MRLQCDRNGGFFSRHSCAQRDQIVKLSLKPLFHGLFGIAASQLCDTLVTQLPFLVHRKGRAPDCGDLLAVPNRVSSQAEHVRFYKVVNDVQSSTTFFAQPVLELEIHRGRFMQGFAVGGARFVQDFTEAMLVDIR